MALPFEIVQIRDLKEAESLPFLVEVTGYSAKSAQVHLDHHGRHDGIDTPAACQQALTSPLPGEEDVVGYRRLDADSLAALAVWASRVSGTTIDEKIVSDLDALDRLGPKVEAGLQQRAAVSAIMQVADGRQLVEEKIAFAQSILAGTMPATEIVRLDSERTAAIDRARAKTIVYQIIPDRLVLVVGSDRWAFRIGYEHAPVVVLLNPAMPGAKGTYRKIGFYAYDERSGINMAQLKKAIAELEPGAGGLDLAWGTVQDVSSQIPIRLAVSLALRCLTKKQWNDHEFTFVKQGVGTLTDEEWQTLDRESGLEVPVKFLILHSEREPSQQEQIDFALLAETEGVLGICQSPLYSVQVEDFEPYLSIKHTLHILLWKMAVRYDNVEVRLLETGTRVSTAQSTEDLFRLIVA